MLKTSQENNLEPSDFKLDNLSQNGWTICDHVLSPAVCTRWIDQLDSLFAQAGELNGPLRSGSSIYGARNLIEFFPEAIEPFFEEPLKSFCSSVLGSSWGVVRGLYFDKPPGTTWSLPWHQDKTISVRSNAISSDQFTRPTTKAGVPHVEAPQWLLEQMLTIRIHLDAMTNSNGPLIVHDGSHSMGKLAAVEAADTRDFTTVLCDAGSAVAMRPLLSHSSILSHEDCKEHRRTVHIELSPVDQLPENYCWYSYIPVFSIPNSTR